MDAVIQNKVSLLAQAVRVSPDKANQILTEIRNRLWEIQALREWVTFKSRGESMVGKTICITGTLTTGTRPQIEQMVKDAGGQVSSSVSSRTTHLVTNDTKSGSSKNTSAARLGIPIISEQDLLQMLGK